MAFKCCAMCGVISTQHERQRNAKLIGLHCNVQHKNKCFFLVECLGWLMHS